MSDSFASSSEDSASGESPRSGTSCSTSEEPQEEPPPPEELYIYGIGEDEHVPCDMSQIPLPCVFIGQLIPQEESHDYNQHCSLLAPSIEGQLRFEIEDGILFDPSHESEVDSQIIPPDIDSTHFQDINSVPITASINDENNSNNPPEESTPRLVEYIGDQFHNKNPHTRRTILLNPRRTSDNDPVVLYRFYQFCCPCSGKVWFSPLHRAKDGCFCRDCHHFLRPFGYVDGLTPYMGHELCYAKFECHVCRRNWSCQKSKSNFPDNCFNCGTIVYPYYQVSHSVLHRKIKKTAPTRDRPPSDEELDEMLCDEEEDAYNSFHSSFAAANSLGMNWTTSYNVQSPTLTKVEKHLLAKFSRARTTRKKSTPRKVWKGSRSLKRNTDETQLARRLHFSKEEAAADAIPNSPSTPTPPTTSSSSSTDVNRFHVRRNSSTSDVSRKGSSVLFFSGAAKMLTSRKSCTHKNDASVSGKIIDHSVSEPILNATRQHY